MSLLILRRIVVTLLALRTCQCYSRTHNFHLRLISSAVFSCKKWDGPSAIILGIKKRPTSIRQITIPYSIITSQPLFRVSAGLSAIFCIFYNFFSNTRLRKQHKALILFLKSNDGKSECLRQKEDYNMDDNKRRVYSVDDYYPNPSSEPGEETDENNSCDAPDPENTENSRREEEQGFDMLTCPKCGNRVSADMNFCSMCGYHFPKSQDTPYPLNNTRIDGYLVDDIASFVAVNPSTYIRKFQKVSEGRISFNWAAAIFSNRWLAYRGMFRTAFLFSIIVNTISGIISYIILMMFQTMGTELTDTTSSEIYMFSMMLSVAIGLIMGLIGDSLYWKRARQVMDRYGCQGREPVSDQRIARSLRALGGCKMGYALLIILFDLSFNEMITYVLQYIFSKM